MSAFRQPNRSASLPRNVPNAGGAQPYAGYGYAAYGYGYGYNGGAMLHEGGQLQRYVNALVRRRRIAIAVSLVVLGAALGYLVVATPLYEAHVKVLIEPETQNVVSFKEVIEENASKLEYYQTQMQILQSRTLARKTLDTLDLWTDPEIAANAEDTSRVGRLASGILSFVSRQNTTPKGESKETAAQSRAIDAFLKRLSLDYRADNRILEIGFTSVDPAKAAQVANAIAKNYIDESLDVKYRAAKAASDWLNERIAEQRKEVEASENALQRYREANGDVSLSEQQNTVLQKLGDLNTAATKAKTERLDTEATYTELQAARDNPAALDSLPIILSNPFIQKLKGELADLQSEEVKMSQRFGDRYPDLIKVRSQIQRARDQIRGEVDKVAQSVGNQYRTAQAKERSLSGALEAQKHQALALDRRSGQYNVLLREATSNRQVFDALLQRAKETGIATELKTSNIRIVDPAEVPLRPSWPRKLPVLLFALMLGLPLGAAVAIGREFVDDRIKSPDEIKDVLGLKFLGFAPTVPANTFKTHGPLVNNGVPPVFAEAFRTVRANVLLKAPGGATRTLLVTSTAPNEGKTVVSCNLALSLAQAGRRVLLVDADLRMSKVHMVFDTRLEPGLSDVLTRDLPIKAAIIRSSVPGLALLTAGATPERPGDIFERPEFERAVKTIAHEYDFIVIDSPPVLAVSDSIGMVHLADGIVFVVGAEMTRRRAVETALEQLDAANAQILGAVLSRVPVEEHSPYYHRSYVPYQSSGGQATTR